ncbi:MAG TPA: MoaD/ThiS family protein [Halanaerobiales bacterium]|nr:MoaD/ThiS family protein [Halanaerobiales bacterium]
MKVKIKLVGSLRKYKNDKINENGEVYLKPNSTINDLINKIGINTDRKLIFLVNGKQQGLDFELSADDKVFILTMVAGG